MSINEYLEYFEYQSTLDRSKEIVKQIKDLLDEDITDEEKINKIKLLVDKDND